MAGLPLKSGADFYNLEAARLRLHNLGADPTEVGAGLIYFNTSTGLNTSQKARLYTGSAWKTIAFSEDLDVAKNEDFLALQRRVDLLSGDVDTDAIINNMKEVSAFLEGFAEDASLMDYLNTELGKKLDISGGEMTGKLVMYNRISMGNQVIEMGKGLFGAYNDGEKLYWLTPSNETWNEILTSAGGTISGALIVEASSPAVTFKKSSDSNPFASLGIYGNKLSMYVNSEAKYYDILHSGNVGEYAMKYYANQGAIDFNDVLYNGIQYVSSSSSNAPITRILASFSHGDSAWQIAGGRKDNILRYRASNGTSDSWSDWKTIAFTDSDITGTAAKAKNLVDSEGKSVAYVSGNTFYIGDSIYPTTSTQILGKDIRLRYGANASFGFWLNSSGNVTIGESDLAGTGAKLYVDGHIKLGASGYLYKNDKTIIDFAGDAPLFGYGTAAAGLGTKVYGSDIRLYYGGTTNVGFILNESGNVTIGGSDLAGTIKDNKLFVDGAVTAQYFNFNSKDRTNFGYIGRGGDADLVTFLTYGEQNINIGTNSKTRLTITGADGNVLIGTTADDGSGARLQVNGDIHVTGNIIADGEVSAGGAAEEGGNAGGGGAFYSDTIKEDTTQTTIAHGLGTDDIVVSIYEKDGVSGRWSLILTDVEIVDANNIIVSFGSATTVEHKVVIMGAVA